MDQGANKVNTTSADTIAIDGITYEIVKREIRGDAEALYLRRPAGRRFYLAYRRNGFARMTAA
jgi:hypothetical protein